MRSESLLDTPHVSMQTHGQAVPLVGSYLRQAEMVRVSSLVPLVRADLRRSNGQNLEHPRR